MRLDFALPHPQWLLDADACGPSEAVDLFAGPGGWDHAACSLMIRQTGIENDIDTCDTRMSAGLVTIEGDVRDYGPGDFPESLGGGLTGSPVCPTFSAGGKGSGRRDLDHVLHGLELLSRRIDPNPDQFDDPRTFLTLEPLRWALQALDAGNPYEWIALEQVPAVLPAWDATAEKLQREGYRVITGILSAEQYGVGQVRERAVLIAGRHTQPVMPMPTHSRFGQNDPGLPPPLSMADVLGWGMTDRPYYAVVAGTDAGGTDPQCLGGSGARKGLDAERAAGRWIEKEHADPPESWARPFTRQSATEPGAGMPAKRNDGARLSINEAAVLQSFPPDYPWVGKKTSQFQQVCNAVPPVMAEAILTEALKSAGLPVRRQVLPIRREL
jgi:DNA (cytosine-5)-methyltransferase 1